MPFKFSSSVIKYQPHFYPKQVLPAIYWDYLRLLCSQWIPHTWKKINIPPPDQFGEMYNIAFPNGGSKIFQHEIFELDPATSGFTMDRKTPDSPSIEASPGKYHIFAATHEDHLHPPFTGQWDLTSTHNIDLGSLLRFLKYITLCGDQVINLCDFHNDLSIALSTSSKNNIEFVP